MGNCFRRETEAERQLRKNNQALELAARIAGLRQREAECLARQASTRRKVEREHQEQLLLQFAGVRHKLEEQEAAADVSESLGFMAKFMKDTNVVAGPEDVNKTRTNLRHIISTSDKLTAAVGRVALPSYEQIDNEEIEHEEIVVAPAKAIVAAPLHA
jgi:hypothetical protein